MLTVGEDDLAIGEGDGVGRRSERSKSKLSDWGSSVSITVVCPDCASIMSSGDSSGVTETEGSSSSSDSSGGGSSGDSASSGGEAPIEVSTVGTSTSIVGSSLSSGAVRDSEGSFGEYETMDAAASVGSGELKGVADSSTGASFEISIVTLGSYVS